MDSNFSNAPEPVLIIIADISGYTRYMTANAKTLAHSQAIITELVKTIIELSALPLEVAKLEGDAVFLFCRKQTGATRWPETKRVVGTRLLGFFHHFREKATELGRSTTCTCNACTHIEKLQLKIVVHSGEALFHRVLNFVELAGVDVIIAHRLLKNSVPAHQYLLLTEAALHDLEFPQKMDLKRGEESYDDIGRIRTLVYEPAGAHAGEIIRPGPAFARRFAQSWGLFRKLWFAPFSSRPHGFRNLSSSSNAVGRVGFAVLTALLTPVFLPVGAAFAFRHALKTPSKVPHLAECHEHKADGSCCHGHKAPAAH